MSELIFQVFYSSMPGNSPFCHRLQILVYRFIGCVFFSPGISKVNGSQSDKDERMKAAQFVMKLKVPK